MSPGKIGHTAAGSFYKKSAESENAWMRFYYCSTSESNRIRGVIVNSLNRKVRSKALSQLISPAEDDDQLFFFFFGRYQLLKNTSGCMIHFHSLIH